jgi:hypothetical protein
MPRRAWLFHFKQARKAGNRSRRLKRLEAQRLAAETERAQTAAPALRKRDTVL